MALGAVSPVDVNSVIHLGMSTGQAWAGRKGGFGHTGCLGMLIFVRIIPPACAPE